MRGWAARIRHDPLEFMEELSQRTDAPVFPLPWGGWCVSDAELALEVLHDPLFHDGTSPFFGKLLDSRSAQLAVGRAVRGVVRTYLPRYRDNLAPAIAELPATTEWPVTGLRLVHRCAADLLLHDGAPLKLRRLLAQAVEGGLMVRPPRIHQRVRVELLRPKLFTALLDHIRYRRTESRGEPRDVLDAILTACPEGASDRVVAELYVLLFRSIVGNVGYVVAWALLLAARHSPPGAPWPWPADWVVREAARHRPFVWMVGRFASRPVELGGRPFRAGDLLSVSPYLLHHDKQRWTRPDAYEPERWRHPDSCGPYTPFSAGPFTCGGAAVAQTMATATVAALADGTAAPAIVSGGDLRPIVTNAAVPRPFILRRST